MVSILTLLENTRSRRFVSTIGRAGRMGLAGTALAAKGAGYLAYKTGDVLHRKLSTNPEVKNRELATLPIDHQFDDLDEKKKELRRQRYY